MFCFGQRQVGGSLGKIGGLQQALDRPIARFKEKESNCVRQMNQNESK